MMKRRVGSMGWMVSTDDSKDEGTIGSMVSTDDLKDEWTIGSMVSTDDSKDGSLGSKDDSKRRFSTCSTTSSGASWSSFVSMLRLLLSSSATLG